MQNDANTPGITDQSTRSSVRIEQWISNQSPHNEIPQDSQQSALGDAEQTHKTALTGVVLQPSVQPKADAMGGYLGLRSQRSTLASISKSGIAELPEFRLPGRCAYIYFLIWRNTVVYIGLTNDLLRRVTKHWDTKAGLFDSVRFSRVSGCDAIATEAALISKFKPRLNGKLNASKLRRNKKRIQVTLADRRSFGSSIRNSRRRQSKGAI